MQTTEQEVTVKTAQQLGLSDGEFEEIKKLLGREPNLTELRIYAALWSEQCSFKNSIKWLRTLPADSKQLSANGYGDNIGLVEIGDGIVCTFKINPHNHSEEIASNHQAASSSANGIHWDILSNGVRPIAALNYFQFGNLSSKQNQDALKNVVKEFADQSNGLGLPTVRSKVSFQDSLRQSIIVNTMSVGLVTSGESFPSGVNEPGNPVFVVGAKNSKDDLSNAFTDEIRESRSGGLLTAKLLLEATLEATETDAIVSFQKIGFAGLACSSAKMCGNAETGMVIDLDKVTFPKDKMNVRDILFSENEEKLLLTAVKGKEQLLFEIFEKWELECVQIGTVSDTGNLEYFFGGEKIAEVPANSLVPGEGTPVYDQAIAKPRYFNEIKRFNLSRVKSPKNIIESAKKLFTSPNLTSKRWVSQQFDSMVLLNNLSTNAPSDADVLRLKGSEKLLAVSIDGSSNYVHADPYIGAMIAVSEAARYITCAGGVPLAVANCLNFGDPYDPEVYYQFVNAVKGLGEACRKFDTPVTHSNVSFYNQSVEKDKTEPIFPTPIIGMLGTIKDSAHHTSLHFKEEGDMIYMLGNLSNDLGSSEYLRSVLNIPLSPPPEFDLYEEFEIQKHIRKLIHQKIVRSAHGVGKGGLFTNLMESAILSDLGFNIETVDTFRKDSFLFGEGQSRIVITIAPEQEDALQNYLINNNVSFSKLGEVFGDVAIIDEENFGSINHWKRIYEDTLSAKLEG
ncbi:MAG: phosphoribosylformylglycinamidine synthase subunit PurL [Saprospiraceae bacterium]